MTNKVYQKKVGLFDEVYEVVRRIPRGSVSTYGQIAAWVGTKDARKIGWALAKNTDSNTPCHRVVNKDGRLAKNFGKSLVGGRGWEFQKEKLLKEGISFVDEDRVDLEKHRWNG